MSPWVVYVTQNTAPSEAIFGPFDSGADASEWALRNRGALWVRVSIQPLFPISPA